MTMLHPCQCTSYNGGQCYNCLNGAHDICDDGCKTVRSKQVGVAIVVTTTTLTKLAVLEREVENTANEIDQMFRQKHSMKELERTLMRLINRLQPTTKMTFPNFEAWWAIEKTRPPYTNPKDIARSAWDHLLNQHGINK